ncbi:WD40 repeat domain-containing protein [Leptolyngbya sp. PCC 6406]|uniref:WD40 repeat domain-containing protein n=1 Tax=Leptolyngbya sp. PCC 6406 TaxID=1173264 RepID=UPI0002AC8D87|nr:WD40 repeat domain-containing protein [Leptolyngbya sp. PCC 6406]
MALSRKPLVELSAQHALADYVTALAWSPVGNTLAIASGGGEVSLLQNFLAVPLQPGSGLSIDALDFSGDGQWLAAAGQAGNVTLWQMHNELPHEIDSLECGSAWVDRLQWHPQENWLAFNRGKTVQIWDADRAEILTSLVLPAHVQDLGWSPNGDHFAVSAQQQVYIWAVPQWQKPRYQWELLSASRRLQWSPEGAYLASANQDNSVGVLTWAQVHCLQQTPVAPTDLPTLLQGFPGKVRQLAWADIPDADKSPILAAATRELVVMGVLVPGEDWESWLLDLHSGTVLDVAFQPKTGLLASLSEDGWIILWQAAVNAAQILEGAQEGFSALAWHPGGQHLAAGGQQGEVLVWSAV